MLQRRSRLLVSLLAVLLISSLIPAGPAAGAAATPHDAVGHWAVSEIAYAVEAGLMKGYSDGSFRPDAAISRGEVYTLLARQKGLAPGDASTLPQGWPQEHWAAPYGAALIQTDILIPAEEPQGGNWDEPITRASLARLLVRLQGRSQPQGVNLLIWDIQGRADAAWITGAVAQGLMTGFADGSFGPDQPFTRAQTAVVLHRLGNPAARPTLWREAYQYTLPSGSAVNLQVVRANLKHPKVRLKALWSPAGVGHTSSLAEMAQKAGAVAAINGTYFNAYNQQAIQDLYGALVSQGRFLHLTGSKRPAIGVWPDGRARIDTFSAEVSGSSDGKASWPNNWYSYGINHNGTEYGPNWVTIMTPDRGAEMGFDAGLSVTVRNGRVTGVQEGAAPIPRDGYVISMNGAEAASFRDRLRLGKEVGWTIRPADGWQGVAELVQAGPLLTRGGQVDVDFARDEFTEAKITEWVYNRSAVGLTADGTLLMVTADAARVADLARIMLDLGAVDSLCLDSGASSGLYYQGSFLWEPGRLLTNALGIVVEP